MASSSAMCAKWNHLEGGWICDKANQCKNLKWDDATITQSKIRSRIPREGLWTPSSLFL